MSIYISRLTSRDGINWPSVGTWTDGEGISRLETFAKNLDHSQSAQTDLLNSVPTPWARLLLFEAALYDAGPPDHPEKGHPAHRDVEDQWRGLLGVLALHEILRLDLKVESFDLAGISGNIPVRDAFLGLRPCHMINRQDVEDGKWNRFDFISVDGVTLGTTSPRTLVFAGIAHTCPGSVPFRSSNGRLSDPVEYYKKFTDNTFLGLLANWLDNLINNAKDNANLETLLGTIPTAPGGQVIRRIDNLIKRLERWREQIESSPMKCQFAPTSRFEGAYAIIKSIQRPQAGAQWNQSDLFLRGRNDVLVCFQREHGSSLVNSQGREITSEHIKIYDGHWIEANQPLPVPLSFIPRNIKVIENPYDLFENFLIEAKLNPETTYALQFQEKHYLLPYKKEILDYLMPQDIAQNTEIHPVLHSNRLKVELKIPLVNNRVIKAFKEYREDDQIITEDQVKTANLAMWPDFICTGNWSRYFYYKNDVEVAGKQVDFQPTSTVEPKRTLLNRTWFMTTKPLDCFVGTVDGKQGLLLIKYQIINKPNKSWKVAIDLGSTHTRAFSLEVGVAVAGIQPINIVPQARELTKCDPINLQENFFVKVDRELANVLEKEEFTTQLVMPQPVNEDRQNWLPREGFIYLYSLLDGFPQNEIRHNLKWNSNTNDHALRAFLRCLLVLVEAEAIRRGARVKSISHSYPSVFTPGLVLKHGNEWAGLSNYSGLSIEDPLMESEAVGRHLQVEQQAPVAANIIALDIGGSTTDIALWTSNRLARQESVKMAAGVVGRYVEAEPGQFKKWFLETLRLEPFNRRVSLDKFDGKDLGYSLMFNATLGYASSIKHLGRLIDSINKSPEGQPLIAYVQFVFGALLYYVGLLGRKAGMMGETQFYIYFCGKGGQFITWIPGHSDFVQEMFSAGLFGPQGSAVTCTVMAIPSKMPKEEVGRGLLAESSLGARGTQQAQGGLLNLAPPTVTVGEEGYSNLSWNGELDGNILLSLPQQIPPYNSLKEMKTFVEAFVQGTTTQKAAKLLGLNTQPPPNFTDALKERLFGRARGRIVYDIQNNPDESLLEPLFITEVKVLLETLTRNPRLFV